MKPHLRDPLTGLSGLLLAGVAAGCAGNAAAMTETGLVTGTVACNRFFGTVDVTGESIAFRPLGSARMAWPEAVMNQESKYLKALQDAERYALDGPFLLIHARGMDRPLRFTRHTRSVMLRPAALASAVLAGSCGDGRPDELSERLSARAF